MEKIVWVTKVISRNFMSDFIANAKNILGGRLKTYERMLNKALEDVTKEFYDKYPEAKQVRIISRYDSFNHIGSFGCTINSCIFY